MGLYDTPLPPRPPAPQGDESNDNNDNGDREEEEEDMLPASSSSQRLFSMNQDGTERHNLLPALRRRLDYGIDCYYEISDRQVQNLVKQTSCHPLDAAWALESCQGDVTEAWTRISVAQRLALEQATTTTESSSSTSSTTNDSVFLEQVKSDLYDLLSEEDFEELKEQRQQEEQKRKKQQDLFRGSDKDAKWLPLDNPKPVDDEPWFTG